MISFDELLSYKGNLEAAGNKGRAKEMQKSKGVDDDKIEEWSVTKKAPKHAAWLYEK